MKKIIQRVLVCLLALFAALSGVFLVYAGQSYAPAAAALQAAPSLCDEGRYMTLPGSGTRGIIFYPGAKVEPESYLPLLARLNEQGFTCVLAEMPFNFAFFGVNAADKAMELHPEVKEWYLMGHSLGGAMAGAYTAEHPEDVQGLILLGAYLYGDVPAEKVLVLYGSEDGVLNRERLTGADFEQELPGCNHAGFGDYGPQKGDGQALLSPSEQQALAVEHILAFTG